MAYELDLKKAFLKKMEALSSQEVQETLSERTSFGIQLLPRIPILFHFWPLRILSSHAS